MHSCTSLNKTLSFLRRPGSSSDPEPGGAGSPNSCRLCSGGISLLSSHVQMQEKQ